MTINKVVVCPICKKQTWLRLLEGGYLNEYPVRIHCMNCRALMKGTYIMGGSTPVKGLQMLNAGVIECDVVVENQDDKGLTYIVRNADYIAEISGELPCPKVRIYDGKTMPSSMFLETEMHIDMLARIEQLKCFTRNLYEWKKKKSTAFQLLDEGSIEFLPIALENKIGEYKYKCDHDIKSLHSLQDIVLYETQNIFVNPDQTHSIKELLEALSSANEQQLHAFTERIGGIQSLIDAFRKTIEVFSCFMSIYANVLPAETYMQYKDKQDDNELGIATCSFTDIKTFYQDSYESLLSLIFIPVCLDNILLRGDYNLFNPSTFLNLVKRARDVKEIEKQGKTFDDYEWFLVLDHGMKIERLQRQECIQSIVDFPGNRLLRNGIGHNNIKYDGISQTITAYDKKDPSVVTLQISLMEMALECIRLARSSVILAEIVLFILRREYSDENNHFIIAPRFYSDTGPYDKCPCGSGLGYKWCCKKYVDSVVEPS